MKDPLFTNYFKGSEPTLVMPGDTLYYLGELWDDANTLERFLNENVMDGNKITIEKNDYLVDCEIFKLDSNDLMESTVTVIDIWEV